MKVDSVKQFLALRASLQNERSRLEARLAEINRALGQLPAPASAPAAKRLPFSARAINTMPLKEAVVKVTRDRPLTKPEILKAIKKLGYRFKARNPLNSLNVTLYTKGNFRNVNGKFSPLKA